MPRIRAVAVLAGLGLVALASAQEAPSQAPALAPATDYMRQVAEGLLAEDHFSFSVDIAERHVVDGTPRSTESTCNFWFARPAQIRMEMRVPGELLTLTGNGQQVCYALESVKQFRITEQPDDLGTLVGWLTQQPSLRRIFSADPAAGWLHRVEKNALVEAVDGEAQNRLEFTFPRTDLTLWFDKDEPHLVKRLLADLSRGAHQDAGHVLTEMTWPDWDTTTPIAESRFALTPPAGYKEVDAFRFGWTGHSDAHGAGTEGLLGAPATPLTADLLDGGKFDLADHRGQHLVILDFWATWCRPCRGSLETQQRLAREWGGQGVRCYAVNLMEPVEKVRAYVEDRGLSIPVILDQEGRFAEAFRIEAVPTTVLIGFEGNIQAVHVGTDRWLERELSDEIEKLLVGDEPAEQVIHAATPGEQLRYRLGLDRESFCAVFVAY